MVVDGRSYTQRQGDLVLLRPGIVHSSHSNGEGFTYFCMHFDIDDKLFLSLLSRLEQVLFPAEGTVAGQMGPALGKLLDLSTPEDIGIGSDSVAKRMRIQSAVFELFATLWEAVSSEAAHLPGRGYVQAELAHQIASRLQGRVNQPYGQAGSVEKQDGIEGISSELGISVSHCNRVFRSVFGVSPVYIYPGLCCMRPSCCWLIRNGRCNKLPICSAMGILRILADSSSAGRASRRHPIAKAQCREAHLNKNKYSFKIVII